jgi:hypothetical protein
MRRLGHQDFSWMQESLGRALVLPPPSRSLPSRILVTEPGRAVSRTWRAVPDTLTLVAGLLINMLICRVRGASGPRRRRRRPGGDGGPRTLRPRSRVTRYSPNQGSILVGRGGQASAKQEGRRETGPPHDPPGDGPTSASASLLPQGSGVHGCGRPSRTPS